MTEADRDQGHAAREAAARTRLLAAGAAALPRAPWLRGSQPLSAADLIRFAVWRAGTGDLGEGDLGEEDELLAALTLLPAARAEVDQAEAALLFTARARGLSWLRISRAMGLRSAQAAQQRCDRVTGRAGSRGSP
jgi:hypothetical protein